MNLGSGFFFLIDTLFDLYLYVIIARFVLQMVRADFYNPLSQFIVKVTSPLLIPMRKIIPGVGGVDVASIVLLYLLTVVKFILIGLLFRAPGLVSPEVAAYAIIGYGAVSGIVGLIINFFLFVIIITAIMSWFAMTGTYNPVGDIFRQMSEPLLAPARRIIPPIGMMDISTFVVILLLLFIKRVFGF